MRKINLLFLLFFCLFSLLKAAEKSVTSPDGKLVVCIGDSDGKAVFNVLYDGKVFLENSPLGMETNVGDFTHALVLGDQVQERVIREVYSLPNIKKSLVNYEAREGVFSFFKDEKPAFDVIFRLSNNDVAFRYKVYPRGERLSCMVNREATGFVLPHGTTTFLCPQSKPMVGFARTMPSYETSYEVDAPMGTNGRDNNGFTFPCLFKVNNNGWVLISETGVDSHYCGSRLMGHANGLYTIGYPMEGENNGNGTAAPGLALPGYTPWRTISLGTSLAPIVESTVAFDVVKPLYEASQKYEYTKGSWSWIMKMDGATVYNVQKEYIDFSAAMGYQTVLVDALWDTQIGYDKIEELAKYGASKGVSLYLWYNSNGYWNDAPQGPRGIMDNTIARRKEMAWMKRIGVKGIKVDFFGGDKQVSLKLYEDILADANDYGIMVIFHGCTLPRGWERMYPNYASSEAVLASENLHFGQGSCDHEAFNGTIHPFIRNTVGSMDFGGSALNQFYNAHNTPGKGTKRMTSDVYALATAVLFQSGVQHFALAPNNLSDAPAWAIDFMKSVPSTWDEVRYIDGYPGKYVVLARRKGNQWYVAGINAQKEPVTLTLQLPMLQAGMSLTSYVDDATLNGSKGSVRVGKANDVKVVIPHNGAVVLVN
ncbi:MAG: glycoside hydrolase family 97 protein [Marinilabiliaceae bacterium]|nr:glycoside hydrolase family 97 protein [Marinilabiliaceae bacterium]